LLLEIVGASAFLLRNQEPEEAFALPGNDPAWYKPSIGFQNPKEALAMGVPAWTRRGRSDGPHEADRLLGINAEYLTPATYALVLRVVAGKEPPAKGQKVTTKFQFLLPYFVLAGMAGIRTCELIRYKPSEPVLEWTDILWNKNLIFVRQEIAKETRARDRKRYIPLETRAAEILKPLTRAGAVMPCSPSHFNRGRRKLAAAMRLKLPENCLRNSYATYALTFRSLGDVAKAMGDAEATVKRYYIETLEPDVGREWFAANL
jgi:hypothetical protein